MVIFKIKCTGAVLGRNLITYGEYFSNVAMPIAGAKIIFVGFAPFVIWFRFIPNHPWANIQASEEIIGRFGASLVHEGYPHNWLFWRRCT